MAKLENIYDVLEVAVRIEDNGVDFYTKLRDITQDSEAKEMFSYLALQEKNHAESFRKLMSDLEAHKSVIKYPKEYELFLDAVAARGTRLFQDALNTLLANNVAGAVNIGMDLEMDSILFYKELQERLDPAYRRIIDVIIEEEKSHLSQLEGIKYKLQA
jgi:rubrerythrin